MRSIIPILLIMSGVVLMLPAHSLPTAGSQLFFDDFTSSSLSPNWSPICTNGICNNKGNVSQSGGYFTMTLPRNAASPFGPAMYEIADGFSGIAGPNMPDGQFYDAIWRLQPFNYTNLGNVPPGGSVAVRNAEIDIGFISKDRPGIPGGFGIQLVETDL